MYIRHKGADVHPAAASTLPPIEARFRPFLAEHYGAGVYTAFRRQDLFPSMHPNFLGHLGLEATPQIRQALDHADVVLALGTRLDEITSGGYSQPKPSSTVIQVYPSDQEIGRPLRSADGTDRSDQVIGPRCNRKDAGRSGSHS